MEQTNMLYVNEQVKVNTQVPECLPVRSSMAGSTQENDIEVSERERERRYVERSVGASLVLRVARCVLHLVVAFAISPTVKRLNPCSYSLTHTCSFALL